MNTPAFDYITYGSPSSGTELTAFLQHILSYRFAHSQQAPTPICIWGRHGIGKTAIVKEVASALGAQLVYIAPAQFEEMGDLLGLPQADAAGSRTVYLPPAWAPRNEGPGILLIDDVNRADDRILRGIMQLLQDYELASWKLPANWQIVLTANPDGGDYSVTPLDDAILTRLMHITLVFDAGSWARWAHDAGIDPRGIDFVLTYPELVTGRRTTPRSLTQLFEALQSIADWQAQMPLVTQLAHGALDDETASAFTAFLQGRLNLLWRPEELLDATDPGAWNAKWKSNNNRQDILYIAVSRLTNYLLSTSSDLNDLQYQNLLHFLTSEDIPGDLRFVAVNSLAASDKPSLQRLLAEPALGRLLLGL